MKLFFRKVLGQRLLLEKALHRMRFLACFMKIFRQAALQNICKQLFFLTNKYLFPSIILKYKESHIVKSIQNY